MGINFEALAKATKDINAAIKRVTKGLTADELALLQQHMPGVTAAAPKVVKAVKSGKGAAKKIAKAVKKAAPKVVKRAKQGEGPKAVIAKWLADGGQHSLKELDASVLTSSLRQSLSAMKKAGKLINESQGIWQKGPNW